MKAATRLIIGLLCLLVAGQAFLLWSATGKAVFTRYHNPDRDQAATTPSDSARDLFEQTGLEDDTGPIQELPNRFMLGLFPSGPDRHFVSLATLTAPLLLALAILWLGPVVSRRKPAHHPPA
jgi:hypothetical protein